MSLFGTMRTSISGMNGQSTRMSTVADNIATRPSARQAASLVYDQGRGTLLLVGGEREEGLTDTWEFDAVDWRLLVDQPGLPGRSTVAYHDTAQGRTTLFGGYDLEVWQLVEPGSATFRVFGEGCLLRPAQPFLHAPGGGRPVAGEVFTVEGSGMSDGPFALLLIGNSDREWFGLSLPFDLSVIGMTHCSLLVRPDVAVPM